MSFIGAPFAPQQRNHWVPHEEKKPRADKELYAISDDVRILIDISTMYNIKLNLTHFFSSTGVGF